jgi:4-amino-4-deoxy-L-arabinose transferase-like glycosyltransferase
MNEWRILRSMHLVSGSLIFLAIAAPWHILVQRANPEFFQFYFIHEHFERYLTKVHGRFKPFWFFIPILFGGLLPWTAFLAQAVRHNLPRAWSDRNKHPEALFLILWAVLIFLFFSRSDSKLIPYILPVFPPLALIIGKYLAEVWDGRHQYGIRCATWFLIILYALFTAALLIAPHYRPEIDMHDLRPHLYALAAIQLISCVAAMVLFRKIGSRHAVGVLLVCTVLFLVVSNTIMPYLDTRSAKELADTLRPLLKPGDEVVSYHTYYQDLPVYLERTIAVTGWRGELEFGSRQENVSGWMIDETEFWRRWNGPSTVFLVTSRTNYDTLLKNSGRTFFFVTDSRRDIVLTNERIHR